MTPRDKLNREVLNVVNNMKDNVAKNLAQASRDGTIQIDDKQLERVILIVNQTLEAAYHRTNRIFMRSVDDILASVSGTNEKKS